MKILSRHSGGYRWEGIPLEEYKSGDAHDRDVSRQVLFATGPGALRYFEVAPGGHTSLERHEHVHEVMILHGAGGALVGSEVFDLSRLDLIRVPAMTWHQLRAADSEPLGFLCLVDADRDRPQRPTAAELEALRSAPGAADFIRA